ncbi:acyl--CoA ligase [Alicyclobacillus tolerans]|uniref:class I adenylate-forming enzyme family protein n=1 Tax=Alicyclobacillus tolerans TaxID=90970 RepID=UPI001F249620|nr:class I adenylate-forming enzyme family protein [Alicyclobacillus tolerans]MCF8565477.1 acyl--CoA ligase [Alicyclobacillus tolerans]
MDIGYVLRRTTSELSDTSPCTPALLLENDEEWSFGDLRREAANYARALQSLGVNKGDRVGMLLYNCLEYYALYFAIVQLGAIAVRINFRLKSEELKYIISNAACKVLCLHSELADEVAYIRDSLPVEYYIAGSVSRRGENSATAIQGAETGPASAGSEAERVWALPWSVLENGGLDDADGRSGRVPAVGQGNAGDRVGDKDTHEIEPIDLTLDDPAMLMYTSGTTGLPKGALWTHGNTLWFASMQIAKWNFDTSTVIFPTGPQYHVGALEDLALPTLAVGGRVVILRSGHFNMENVLSIIEKRRVTHTLLFPNMIYELINLPTIGSYDLSSLKVIYTGGDPLSEVAIETLLKKLPSVQLMQMYGLTEGTPIATCLDGEFALQHPESAGRPLPFTEIKVVGEDGQPVNKGAVGEIYIHSPAVAKEYWRNPKATAETFQNGWCSTGDLGRITDDGFLVVTGRKKDMIRSGGENIYATEIENVIARHPKVREVAVIGVPHPKYLETVCAVVVLHNGEVMTEDELIDFCRDKLAGYKRPRHVRFVEKFPRTPSSKIQKFILREQIVQTHVKDWA